eukprot:g9270.t1
MSSATHFALTVLNKIQVWHLQSLLHIEPGYTFRRRRRPGYEAVFIEHGYGSLADCWNRPISSSPGAYVKVVKRERKSQTFFQPLKPLTLTDEEVLSTNLASYNYLGFGGVDNFCTEFVANCIAGPCGFSTCAARGGHAGTRRIHLELEAKIADFLGKEDALVYGMGFATNSIHIPALVDPEGNGKDCLILSDILNHRSIVEGVRMSGVTVRAFKHNDMVDLEDKLKTAWRKIIVIVEGIYSMEGDFCRLRETVALKNKYGAYLYLDEAHSIGAVGKSGRGVSELLNVPTGKVDVMMGTFTKSFGSAGGYIAGDKAVIDALRKNAASSGFSVSMSPACAAQAYAALHVIQMDPGSLLLWGFTCSAAYACAAQAYAALHVIQMDPVKGAAKLKSIRENSNYFRDELQKMGYCVLGDVDSPVIPVLMDPLGMLELSKSCLDLGVAIVVVGYPATPFLLNRARFCIRGERLGILYCKSNPKKTDWRYYRYIRECKLEVAPYEKRPVCNEYLWRNGFGACGPRGFYGGTTEHLLLEQRLASFFKKVNEECVLYSHSVTVASSVFASMIMGSDHVFCHEAANFGIRAGLRLNRSGFKLSFFRDLDHLEELLRTTAAPSFSRPSKQEQATQYYVVAESLSSSDGTVLDLPRLIEMKKRHGLLIALDESMSFAALGPRGLVDHFNVPVTEVDVVMASLEYGIGGIGGFCATSHALIRDLRLTSSGFLLLAVAF